MSINQVTLVGRLGGDPEVYVVNDKVMVRVSVATTDTGYVNSKGEMAEDETNWHSLVMWGKMASIAKKSLHKGDKIMVSGILVNHSYLTTDGQKRSSVDVAVEKLEKLASVKRKLDNAAGLE